MISTTYNFFTMLKRCVVFLFLASLMNMSHAISNKHLWPMWEVNNPLSKNTISHQKWQAFLDKRVFANEEGINLVDYPHIDSADKKLLKNYIDQMSKINIDDYNRKEQLAYWINVYNALTVNVVVNYYPVSSIRKIKISPGLFSIGPWGANLINVTHMDLSLDEIHNRIIRSIWNDPRTHYAINNATLGAANLSKEAYRGAIIESQLNEAASNYINSLRGAQVIEGKLIVSKIYEWFAEDFGDNPADVIDHIKQFAKEPLYSQLKHINTIDSYVYNWHLNSPPQ